MFQIVGRIILWLFLFILLFILLSLTFNHFSLPDPSISKFRCKPALAKETESFPRLVIPPRLIGPVRTILESYPELASVKINFRYASISSSMAARPVINLSFFNQESREYCITINDNSGSIKGVCFDSCSDRIIAGWIAHEFGHILDYRKKSMIGLMAFALNYFYLDSFRRQVERTTDISVINRGLGPELKEGLEYSLRAPELSEPYKINMRKFYMSTGQLDSLMTVYYKNCPPHGILLY